MDKMVELLSFILN